MKKLLLVLAFIAVPVLSFASVLSSVKYVDIRYNFDWDSFVYHNRYSGGSGERRWKYGYIKKGETVLPKEPSEFQVPNYIKDHHLIGGELISLENVRSKLYTKKDAIEFIKFNRGYLSIDRYIHSDDRIWGITRDGIYFPLLKYETKAPFTNLANSLIVTIQNRCELEKREPTVSEKYYVLYFCCADISSVDNAYYSLNQNKIDISDLACYVFGITKLFIICIFVLFCMTLPAVVLLVIKGFTPKNSIFHKAASMVEYIIIILGGASLIKSFIKK